MSAGDAVRRAFEAASRHDVEELTRAYSPEAIVEDPQYPEPIRGQRGVQDDFEAFLRGFPDLRAEIRSVLDGEDRCAWEATLRGTHRGPLSGPTGDIPATGRSVEVRMAGFTRVDESGSIVEEHRYYDMAGLIDQLGVMEPPMPT
jgi:steroid delta-isomerase-like uncharacterized protein